MDSLCKTSSYCSLTMSGKSSSFLSFNASSTENICIIDFGATDHMTPHSSYFSSYTVLSGNQHITMLMVPLPLLLVVVTSTFNLPFL